MLRRLERHKYFDDAHITDYIHASGLFIPLLIVLFTTYAQLQKNSITVILLGFFTKRVASIIVN